jgi:heat shock protein HspQ
VIRHRLYEMRGVIFDVSPSAGDAKSDSASAAELQGLVYRLFAEDDDVPYVASIAEHDLLPDHSGEPVNHPEIGALLEIDGEGGYRRRKRLMN